MTDPTPTESQSSAAPNDRPRLNRWALAGIVAVAIALRLVAVATNHGIDNDSYTNIVNARNLAAGRIDQVDPRIPVLYPAVLAVGAKLDLPIVGYAQAVNLLAGALGAAGCALLAFEVARRQPVALAAGLLYAVAPGLAGRAGRVVTEPIHIALATWMLFAVVRGCRGRTLRWIVLSAVLLALAALCRFEGIAYGLAVVFVIVVKDGWRLWADLRWKIAAAALVTVIGFAGLVPTSLLMHRLRGTWKPLPPLAVQPAAVEQAPKEPAPPVAGPSWWDRNGERMRTFLKLTFVKALPEATFYGVFLLPALVGLGVRAVGHRWTWMDTGLAFFCLWRLAVLFLGAGVSDRYLYPLLPALMVWSAVGLVAVADLFGRWRAVVLAVLLAATAVGGVAKSARPTNESGILRREVARVIVEDARQRGIEELEVASFVPQYAYYADARWYEMFRYDDLGRRDLDELSERLTTGRAEFHYLVVERWNAEWNMPGFTEKIDRAPLQLIASFEAPEAAGKLDRIMKKLRAEGRFVQLLPERDARIEVYRVVSMEEMAEPIDPAAP